MNPRRASGAGEAALVYARRGWPVFPCHVPLGRTLMCSCATPDCSSPGKHPRVAGGLRAASVDERQLARWWRRWPAANVGLRTGSESGLIVIDVDPGHGGLESLAALVDRHGDFHTATRAVRTGGGGWHYYFRHPGGAVPNDTGRRLGPGIDVRGDGGYVLAPPSLHASGRRYALDAKQREIVEPPSWLVECLTRDRERPAFPTCAPGTMPDRWAERALTGELERLHEATEGNRNDTLNRIAFRLGQIIGAGGLDEGRVESVLVQGAQAIGLGEREALSTVRSGVRAGERVPRGPSGSTDRSMDVGLDA